MPIPKLGHTATLSAKRAKRNKLKASPYDLFALAYGEEITSKLKIKKIDSNNVNLTFPKK